MAYNGWANFETWKINLEIVGDLLDSLENTKFFSRGNLAEYLEDYINEVIEKEATGFALSAATSFVDRVDWMELADTYISDNPRLIGEDNEDEDNEDEDNED